MGAAKPLDKEINQYLSLLTERQKEAVLTVVKTFAEEGTEYDYWKEESFVAEMDKRISELESGEVKGISWEEVKKKARHSLKDKKGK